MDTHFSSPRPNLRRDRLESVDALRGVAMIVMALDHVREFFAWSAIHGFKPNDLAHSSVPIFLTRWITHFCAPTFIFLAGFSAALSVERGKSIREVSRQLVVRGLWLVFLDLVVVDGLWTFDLSYSHAFVQVLWAIGWSMIILSALVYVPRAWICGFALILILGHDAFDHFSGEKWGAGSWIWRILHSSGRFKMPWGGSLGIYYPLVPWIGVMALGYVFGPLIRLERKVRRKTLLSTGLGLVTAFLVLRAINVYGDPQPWGHQRTLFTTICSFLNVGKYPPSLCYVLMTLGPALTLLAILDRPVLLGFLRPAVVFGRVPMFFYLIHILAIHGCAVVYFLCRFGNASWSLGAGPRLPPETAGVGLQWIWLIWGGVVVGLYPLCRAFAEVKRRSGRVWAIFL